MEKDGKTLATLCLSFFIFIVIYFFYRGITTTPYDIKDSDSLGYHIPIAQSLAKGNFFKPPNVGSGFGYYPAIGESILAIFLLLGIPANLFNVLAIILFFVLNYHLARAFQLDKNYSLVYATCVSLLNSVVRLIHNQTIDIWLGIFFTAMLIVLNKFKKDSKSFFILGTTAGLLIGVKYSGVLYVITLLLVYSKPLLEKLTLKKLIYFSLPLLVFGFSWHIRNYTLTSNPFYPANIFGFSGHPNFALDQQNTIRSLLRNSYHLLEFLQALVSEYLIWSLGVVVVIIYLAKKNYKKNKNLVVLGLVGLINFAIFFFLPSYPQNVISDLRYLFPSFIAIILFSFLLAQKYKFQKVLGTIALLCSVSILPQLSYRPKLIIIWLISISVLFYKELNLVKERE